MKSLAEIMNAVSKDWPYKTLLPRGMNMSDEQAVEARAERMRADIAKLLARAEQEEQELSEARQGIEAAEHTISVVQQEWDKEKSARQQAERERDEARAELATLHEAFSHEEEQRRIADAKWHEAAEAATRAEADNAELLVQARRMEIGGADDECVWCGKKGKHRPKCPVGLMLAGDHPGAALLERLRALEKVRAAVEPEVSYLAAVVAPPATRTLEPDEQRLLDACRAADALKGET